MGSSEKSITIESMCDSVKTWLCTEISTNAGNERWVPGTFRTLTLEAPPCKSLFRFECDAPPQDKDGPCDTLSMRCVWAGMCEQESLALNA